MVEIATIPLLIVDDEVVALELISRLLTRTGFETIDRASNGAAALTMMQEKAYRAVISDWNMPEMTGLQLVRAIRADDKLRKTSFIMTSIDGGIERVRVARQNGVDAFLIKPFDGQTLRAKLNQVLGVPGLASDIGARWSATG